MSFQPVVPFGGNVGWAFLQRTREAQQTAFEKGPLISRSEAHFRKTIANVTSAEQLVADRQLLDVALTAFGLEADIDSTFFVQKVLADGISDPEGLANRLSDKRYYALSEAFGFGEGGTPHTQKAGFSDEILSAYKDRSFEIAVGNRDPNMRLAIGLEREIEAVAERQISEDGLWYTVMATPPLRQVFEKAFGMPVSVGALDIERQLEIFKQKASQVFGAENFRQFLDPEKQEELTRLFLVRADLQSAPSGLVRGSVALALLQSATAGSR